MLHEDLDLQFDPCCCLVLNRTDGLGGQITGLDDAAAHHLSGTRGTLRDLSGLSVGAAAIVLNTDGVAVGAGCGVRQWNAASADNVDVTDTIGEHTGGAIVAQAANDRRDWDNALVTEL